MQHVAYFLCSISFILVFSVFYVLIEIIEMKFGAIASREYFLLMILQSTIIALLWIYFLKMFDALPKQKVASVAFLYVGLMALIFIFVSIAFAFLKYF